jgi:hypothetical protein
MQSQIHLCGCVWTISFISVIDGNHLPKEDSSNRGIEALDDLVYQL